MSWMWPGLARRVKGSSKPKKPPEPTCEMCGGAAPIYHSDNWLGKGPKDVPLRFCAKCEPIGLAEANLPSWARR